MPELPPLIACSAREPEGWMHAVPAGVPLRELLEQFSSRFHTVRLAYSYHLIGASLDAVFFASFKLPVL